MTLAYAEVEKNIKDAVGNDQMAGNKSWHKLLKHTGQNEIILSLDVGNQVESKREADFEFVNINFGFEPTLQSFNNQ